MVYGPGTSEIRRKQVSYKSSYVSILYILWGVGKYGIQGLPADLGRLILVRLRTKEESVRKEEAIFSALAGYD